MGGFGAEGVEVRDREQRERRADGLIVAVQIEPTKAVQDEELKNLLATSVSTKKKKKNNKKK